MTRTKEEIKNNFQKIAEPLKEAVASLENFEFVTNLGRTLALPNDKVSEIYNEVTWVLLGFNKIDDFEKNIKTLINNDEAVSTKIINDIRSKIFESLKEYINNPKGSDEKQTSSADVDTNSQNITKSLPASIDSASNQTPQENSKQIVEIPNYSNYESGKDPYREPIE